VRVQLDLLIELIVIGRVRNADKGRRAVVAARQRQKIARLRDDAIGRLVGVNLIDQQFACGLIQHMDLSSAADRHIGAGARGVAMIALCLAGRHGRQIHERLDAPIFLAHIFAQVLIVLGDLDNLAVGCARCIARWDALAGFDDRRHRRRRHLHVLWRIGQIWQSHRLLRLLWLFAYHSAGAGG
jgi:hypothetical protein